MPPRLSRPLLNAAAELATQAMNVKQEVDGFLHDIQAA